jgi:hypothetical protein
MIVIGYYTPNNDYKELAEGMKTSVEAQGLHCYIEERPNLSSPEMPKPMPWVLNCSQCGFFIRDMLNKFNDDILYLDADAVMLRYPILLPLRDKNGDASYDFAAPFVTTRCVTRELTSNTL